MISMAVLLLIGFDVLENKIDDIPQNDQNDHNGDICDQGCAGNGNHAYTDILQGNDQTGKNGGSQHSFSNLLSNDRCKEECV